MMVLSLQEVLWVLEIKRIDLRMNVNVRKPTLAHFRMIPNIKYVPLAWLRCLCFIAYIHIHYTIEEQLPNRVIFKIYMFLRPYPITIFES